MADPDPPCFFRIETANHPFVRAADDFLRSLEAVDAALIFETQNELDQVLKNNYPKKNQVNLKLI